MGSIKTITTDFNKNEYWKEEVLEAQEIISANNVINLYPEVKENENKIEGFGGAFTEASAVNYNKLNSEDQRKFLDAYFSEEGLRYNMGRTHINSCDFALSNYTYVEEGDKDLLTFSIKHDEKKIIPLIIDAINTNKEKMSFFASPWSPPAYMKTNEDMNHGGSLKKEYYSLWAEYFVKYLKAYRDKGINFDRVSVQNEPMAVQTWDSCVYTAEEEQEFVKDYLGPTLEKEGLGNIKIFVWDHNKEEAYDRVKEIFSDEKALKYSSGVAVHWYTGDHFDAINIIKRKYPKMEVFFTEGCVEYSRFADSNEVQKAEMYAHDMLGNLSAGANGILDWNLLLDEDGGPNHVGNYCAAPIMLSNDGFEKRLSYYYIGHFSRYIKKGAKKIASTSYTDKVEIVAFLNPEGEKVLVILNKENESVEVTIREKGKGINKNIEAHSITTVIFPI